ncbi:calmodulin-like [Haliotis rufescens]|uniref:calmodulin-like n=1 Tax=Haliotis rufescens TaxID=6454 RepID=UPI00201E8287|nr:calmodulin-like [Haliotis rufescens]
MQSEYELSEEQIKDFTNAFKEFSGKDEGTIATEKLGAVLTKLNLDLSDVELKEMISEGDPDGKGTLDLPQFLNMMSKKLNEEEDEEDEDEEDEDSEEEYRAAFRLFDKDGDGSISATEVKAFLINMGENWTEEEIDDMINEADADGNGEVDYEEFVKMMKSK